MTLAFLLAAPTHAAPALEEGFDGALRGCEEWILNPESWSKGSDPFLSAVGLGPKMGLVQSIDDAALPPSALRQGNRYWRINSTVNAGYILVVSDVLPMCHITGGGQTDLQPSIETVLLSPSFKKRWESKGRSAKGEMASTQFRNRDDPALSITISRAATPGQRLDRVQVIATAIYDLGK